MKVSELLDADWRRLQEIRAEPLRPRRWYHGFSPRFSTIVLIRTAHGLQRSGWPRLGRSVALVNFLLFGIEVSAKVDIGPGLVIPHTHGTVIGAREIGSNVTIFHQVTLGAKLADFSFDPALRPHVCDGVTLAAGAKILGPVRIGARSIVGANAVVITDVPPDSVAVGVPARIIGPSDNGDVAS